MRKRMRKFCLIIVCMIFFQSKGWALTNERVFSQFQFNFITPGARATAMGGAFIGLADDATAVESNPAGLATLTVPEISFEFKHLAYTANQIYANPLTPENVDAAVETGTIESELVREDFNEIVKSLPFLSAVYPFKKIVFALYRQESVNYASSYRTSAFPIMIPGTLFSAQPEDATVDLTVTNYGVGLAIQPIRTLSFGISPRRSELNMRSHSADFFSAAAFGFLANEDPDDDMYSLILPTDFSEADIYHKTEIDGEDVGYSVNAGLTWTPHPKITIGAVYRSGPQFTLTQTLMLTENFLDGQGYGHEAFASDVDRFTLKVPDSFGAGIAFRVNDFLTLMLDVVRIEYKDMLKNFKIVNNPELCSPENFTISNATELHFGGEYILPLGKHYFALRAGVYNEPDHTLRFIGTTDSMEYDMYWKEIFPGGSDQIHVTGGLGLIFNERFQIDTAVNIADKNKQLSLSAIYRF